MKHFSQLEQDNVNYLISHNIPYAAVRLTSNILSHSIIDANMEMRKVLRMKDVHNFSTQNNGVDNKVMVSTHILTFARDIPSTTSLYRSNTRGDERMWPGSAIFSVVEDDDVIVVIPYNKELYIINISKVDLEMSFNTFIDNPIKAFLRNCRDDDF